jgi:hypothetical protein
MRITCIIITFLFINQKYLSQNDTLTHPFIIQTNILKNFIHEANLELIFKGQKIQPRISIGRTHPTLREMGQFNASDVRLYQGFFIGIGSRLNFKNDFKNYLDIDLLYKYRDYFDKKMYTISYGVDYAYSKVQNLVGIRAFYSRIISSKSIHWELFTGLGCNMIFENRTKFDYAGPPQLPHPLISYEDLLIFRPTIHLGIKVGYAKN